MLEVGPRWERLKSWSPRVLDGTVLLGLAVLILYTVSKHEPWADEAQAWLQARDFSWWRLVFHELRYEGHPPVWFAILAVAIHLFHMPYAYLGYLSGAIAVAGLGVLLFLAPFPRILRYLIAGSFFFVYQYAVIARPYVLMPLLGFLAAHFYRKGLSRMGSFAIVIALLIQVSSYAAIVALALFASYALRSLLQWKELSLEDRKRFLGAAALVAFSVVLLVVVLFPPSDSFAVAFAKKTPFQGHLELVAEGLTGAFADSIFVAVLLLALAGLWAYQRGATLLLVLSVGGTALEYGFIRGLLQHQGLITIAYLVSLWAAWPTDEELHNLSGSRRWVQQIFSGALILTFAWQCTWSYRTVRNDWAGPYSGAYQAAMFLKAAGADRSGCLGYGPWAVALQPYFERNIFRNYGGPDAPSSYHWSTEFDDRATNLTAAQAQQGPRFIVTVVMNDPELVQSIIGSLMQWKYTLVYYSYGSRFFKSSPGPTELCLVFERTSSRNPTPEP